MLMSFTWYVVINSRDRAQPSGFFSFFFICSFWFFVGFFFFFRRRKKYIRPAPPPREASHTHITYPIRFTHNRGPAIDDSAEGSRGDRLEAVPSAADFSGEGASGDDASGGGAAAAASTTVLPLGPAT